MRSTLRGDGQQIVDETPAGARTAVAVTGTEEQLGVTEQTELALQPDPGGGDVGERAQRLGDHAGVGEGQQDQGQSTAGPQPTDRSVVVAADQQERVAANRRRGSVAARRGVLPATGEITQ